LFAAIIKPDFFTRHLCNCAKADGRLISLTPIVMYETPNNEHIISGADVVLPDEIKIEKVFWTNKPVSVIVVQANGRNSDIITIGMYNPTRLFNLDHVDLYFTSIEANDATAISDIMRISHDEHAMRVLEARKRNADQESSAPDAFARFSAS